jgi:hypothetical protein
MGRRLRGVGSPAARRLDDDRERRTMEITILSELVDRIDAVHSRTGVPKGRIIETALERHLAGIRLASVPERLLLELGCAPSPGKSEGAESGQSGGQSGCESGQSETDLASDALLSVAGGGEGSDQAPARPKPDIAAARAKIGARTGRKAS